MFSILDGHVTSFPGPAQIPSGVGCCCGIRAGVRERDKEQKQGQRCLPLTLLPPLAQLPLLAC